MYRINSDRFVRQISPPHKREPKRLALFKLVLSPFVKLYDDFYNAYASLILDASTVPQVAVVQYRLNQVAGYPQGTIYFDNTFAGGVFRTQRQFDIDTEMGANIYNNVFNLLRSIKPLGLADSNII